MFYIKLTQTLFGEVVQQLEQLSRHSAQNSASARLIQINLDQMNLFSQRFQEAMLNFKNLS